MSERFDSVWDALFDEKSEAENLRIRSSLMTTITTYISEKKLTQSEAASLLGVSQPRISDIVQGKIDKFTIDTLVNMVAKTDLKVNLVVAHEKAAYENSEVISVKESPWPFKVIDGGRRKKRVVPGFSIGLPKSDNLIETTGHFASIG
jgi:predicted XRE-type DNA-binding protein